MDASDEDGSSPPVLLIDVEAKGVQLGDAVLHEQWVDFYAVLALAQLEGDDEAYVSADELARIGPWRHKVAASVGKEVARHLTWLARQGAAHVVADRGRTKAWRLAVPATSVCLRPSGAHVAAWIANRSAQPAAQETWVADLERLVTATAALHQGEAEAAFEQADAPIAYAGEPALAAWSALIAGRAALQHDDQDRLLDLYEGWRRRTDAVGKTVGSRLRALMAYKNRFTDTAGAMTTLRRLAADLEAGGDVSALASVLNIMGLLAMRLGDVRAGAEHHLRAAALFGIVGDYPSLQGALFNLANCRRRAQLHAGGPPDEAVFKLVELCRLVCKRFGVGADSAQAEIFAARTAFEMGDIPRARRYLTDAEVIVEWIEASFDQACFLLLRAEIEYAHPLGVHDPLRDLQTAERLFLDVADDRSAAEAQRLFKVFSRGRPRA
jgi:hypothetical protein